MIIIIIEKKQKKTCWTIKKVDKKLLMIIFYTIIYNGSVIICYCVSQRVLLILSKCELVFMTVNPTMVGVQRLSINIYLFNNSH